MLFPEHGVFPHTVGLPQVYVFVDDYFTVISKIYLIQIANISADQLIRVATVPVNTQFL